MSPKGRCWALVAAMAAAAGCAAGEVSPGAAVAPDAAAAPGPVTPPPGAGPVAGGGPAPAPDAAPGKPAAPEDGGAAPDGPPADPTRPARADDVIPRPVSLTPGTGAFTLGSGVSLVVPDAAGAEMRAAATWFAGLVAAGAGLTLPLVTSAPAGAAAIELGLDPAITSPEGYRLAVTPERVRIAGRTAAGVFYGLQTLRQLLPVAIEPGAPPAAAAALTIPAVSIEDAPRLAYRGVMLDVSRHFFPVEFIQKLIDLAALYKYNRFHWHLTDDQGWRLEIKKYPRLTEVGAFRDEKGTRVGGFYTQDQVRALVRYAADRFVTIVPEIEIPGHCTAALAAYPEYACTPGPFVIPSAKGIYDGVFCPSEATFTFLGDVLDEVSALFPGKLVHLGGDEVKPGIWKASPVAQAVMMREGLRDATALEGYFMRRLAERARARGRAIIGWDEILDTGELPAGATVMSWRDDEATVRALQAGLDTILTPQTICYLEHYQADPATEPKASGDVMTLAQVYGWKLLPPGLSPAESARVLGSEAVLWTENIATTDYAEYMLFPRALALAEVMWSAEGARDYPGFLRRVQAASARLDRLGVHYAPHFRKDLSAGAGR